MTNIVSKAAGKPYLCLGTHVAALHWHIHEHP